MRTVWKRQNSIRNCPAKNSEISELSPWPSKFQRGKKIHRVDNLFSEYYKKSYVRSRNLSQERLGR